MAFRICACRPIAWSPAVAEPLPCAVRLLLCRVELLSEPCAEALAVLLIERSVVIVDDEVPEASAVRSALCNPSADDEPDADSVASLDTRLNPR